MVYPQLFSSCSQQQLGRFLEEVDPACLLDSPSPDRIFGGPVCGNAFLEPGEECDCGSVEVRGLLPAANQINADESMFDSVGLSRNARTLAATPPTADCERVPSVQKASAAATAKYVTFGVSPSETSLLMLIALPRGPDAVWSADARAYSPHLTGTRPSVFPSAESGRQRLSAQGGRLRPDRALHWLLRYLPGRCLQPKRPLLQPRQGLLLQRTVPVTPTALQKALGTRLEELTVSYSCVQAVFQPCHDP